jgi:hypothetical protein
MRMMIVVASTLTVVIALEGAVGFSQSAALRPDCPSPISRTGKNEARISLTLARLLAILRVMSDAFRTVAVPRSALSGA